MVNIPADHPSAPPPSDDPQIPATDAAIENASRDEKAVVDRQQDAPHNLEAAKEKEQRTSASGGPAQEYLVKTIDWMDFERKEKRQVQIITQNENGPCPLVAICNVLFLRGDLAIRPPDRESVTFEYLVGLLGDYLLTRAPSSDSHSIHSEKSEAREGKTNEVLLTYRYNLDAALSILPKLQSGLDVNVRFSSIRDFESTAELAMFDLFDVDLVHGWIADPQDEVTYRVIVQECGSYNAAVECVVRGDTLSSGAVVEGTGTYHDPTAESRQWSPEEERQIHDGLVAAAFLQDTATQLTYYGLDLLTDSIPSNKLCVLFRNNHFSTLFKHPDNGRLYTLVTDSGLVSVKSFVWESLGDVDQGSSEFFDGEFCKSSILPYSSIENNHQRRSLQGDDLDYAIALSLQQQENDARERRRPGSTGETAVLTQAKKQTPPPPPKRKHHCIIS